MGPVSHAAQVVEKVFVAGRVLVLTRFKMSNMSNSFGGRVLGATTPERARADW
jgi:hypothetical protein